MYVCMLFMGVVCYHSDVEISSGVMNPAPSVKQMLQSVRGLWAMKMTSQFVSSCAAHLHD